MEEGLYRVDQKAFHTEVNLLRRFQKAKKEIQKSIEDILKGSDGKPLPLKGDASAYIDSLSQKEIDKLFPGYSVVKQNGKSYLVKNGKKELLTRQKALESQLERSIESLRDYQDKKMRELLTTSYEEEYYRSLFAEMKDAGVAFDFASLDTGAIKRAVDTRWCQGENYSDRVWKNKALLERSLDKHVVQGIIKGEDFGKMVNQVAHEMNVGYHSAQRLVRTEANRIYNQASMDSYAEGGIEEYQILATLDRKTSKICREQDGKRYPVKDAKVGVNAPPFHPNCRTTTIPVVEFNRIDARAARDPDTGRTVTVPGDMTYDEWYEKYGPKKPENIVKGLEKQVEEVVEELPLKGALYRQGGFEGFQINDYLWNGTEIPEHYKEAIKDLDTAISRVHMPEEMTVYRGIGQTRITDMLGIPNDSSMEDIVAALKKRSVIKDRAFVSTSIDRETAESFGVDGIHVSMEIQIQKGREAFPMHMVNGYDEKEILLPRDTQMTIEKFEVVDGVLRLFLKY